MTTIVERQRRLDEVLGERERRTAPYAETPVAVEEAAHGGDGPTQLPARLGKVLGILANLRADAILDVGCGDGSFSVILGRALQATEVCGIEITPHGYQEARKKNIDCAQMDIDRRDFPFPSDKFDVVCAGEIIEHLFMLDHFLSETRRVLKPGGTVVMSTPNLASWHSRLHLLMGYQPYGVTVISNRTNRRLGSFLHRSFDDRPDFLDPSAHGGPGHVQFFTVRSLREMLAMHGFRVAFITGRTDLPRFPIPGIVGWAVRLCENSTAAWMPSLASGLIVKATK